MLSDVSVFEALPHSECRFLISCFIFQPHAQLTPLFCWFDSDGEAEGHSEVEIDRKAF